jgi:polygalacturonase
VRFGRSMAVSAILIATFAIAATATMPRSKSSGRSSASREVSAPAAGMTSASRFRCSAQGSSASTPVPVVGANSNGSSDDFDAIQNAIDLAGDRGGGVVALPAGTFMINRSLMLANNVELTGVGPATVIKAGPHFLSAEAPGGGYPLISTAGASNTTIAHLTADQSGEMLDGNVPARLTGYVVEGFYSQNVVVDGVYVRNPFTYAIAMVATTGFCVENSNVVVTTGDRYNQLDGIHILDSNTGQVINNFIESGDDGLAAHTIGAPVYNILYANNRVRGGTYTDGIQLAVGNFPIYDIRIEDNDFYGSRFGIRAGYYDSGTGALYDITIKGNYIYDLAAGSEFPAIEIRSSPARNVVKDVTVVNNQVCNAGGITVVPGTGNVVRGTMGCQVGR